MAIEHTIVLTKEHAVFEDRRRAGAAISPGMLLAIDANDDFIAHATAGGDAAPVFARENSILGKGVETDIAQGDQVPAAYMQRGGLVMARLDSTSIDAVAGSQLESAGNGNLRVLVADGTLPVPTDNIVGYAEEDVTSPVTGFSFIRVRT